ncbi:DUF2332 family protein [Arthrobacter sp. APC 3897]|uniref:DUF2332 family protein n=1 Tax=Arthrobacter sp. APC 3897 TaxID=3035204 RepID=UPI0025B330E0|nr:DUF2332 family protein [Arthrobacter sp. APC 3897]MDN3483719.1 DUF2332 family protein [Arthrobacter sp. APC 3897]
MNGVAEIYERFADVEARNVSPIYEEWARGISRDPGVCDLIGALPRIKRQPNLVFAAARLLGALAGIRPAEGLADQHLGRRGHSHSLTLHANK